MSSMYSSSFRINLAEYYLVDDSGMYKKIIPRPKMLFDNSSLIIVSKLDQKVYDFTGINASEKQETAAHDLARLLANRFGFSVERIVYPEDNIPPEHLQFIEYFVEENYLPKKKLDTARHYLCYFCEQAFDINQDKCSNCGKEIFECFVCNRPILYGDMVGKCSLCGATAHLVHFYEWIKSLGMCSKCNQKLHPEGIIPITEENKDTFFE